MTTKITHFIGGKSVYGLGDPYQIYNPNTGQMIAEMHGADLKQIRIAVEYAQLAFAGWHTTPALKRANILRKFAQIIEQREQELAGIVSIEHGKTLGDAKASIQRGLELVHYHAAIQQQLQGNYSDQVATKVHAFNFRQPLGICLGVAPFNFPVMVPLWLMIPALASGNAFILKPSEKTPSASLKLVSWLEEAGLPSGVAQCVQGGTNTVSMLIEQPEIKAISAVGSTQAALNIYTKASQGGKRCATFGGAKNHALVMPDANLEHAADAIISAAFGSSGQRCMALSVVMTIDQETPQQLIPLLQKRMKAIKLGYSNDQTTDMGPVNSLTQLQFLQTAIQQGIEEGAKLVFDGRQLPSPDPQGYFIGPCLFDEVSTKMFIYQQELFGPILIILRLSNYEQALSAIANHPYGNGAVIFTQSGRVAQNFIEEAQAGMVGVNIPIPVPIVSHPFGGWKQSSFGAHGMHGMESLNFYTKNKSVTLTWPEQSEVLSFHMPHL